MRRILYILFVIFLSCKSPEGKESVKNEIFLTEQNFVKMASEKGIAEAFYFFADEKAVIKRENDTLISGKENIRIYFEKKNIRNTALSWTPDFIEISNDGSLGYTYGKYIWRMVKDDGDTVINTGIFHTVWKKQHDGSWRYVWD